MRKQKRTDERGGDFCADTKLTKGDVFAVGGPGDEGLLATMYNYIANEEAKVAANAAADRGASLETSHHPNQVLNVHRS